MSRYDWSKAKPWAKAIATDSDGIVFQYEKEPYLSTREWLQRSEIFAPFDLSGRCESWKDSLELRPAHSESEWLSEQRVNMGAKP
jgi:hypothetical protein